MLPFSMTWFDLHYGYQVQVRTAGSNNAAKVFKNFGDGYDMQHAHLTMLPWPYGVLVALAYHW
jgi:hypothetical protein